MILGKADILEVTGGLREMEGSIHLHSVVGLFEEACLDLPKVLVYITFAEAEHPQGNRFNDSKVTLKALRDPRILNLNGVILSLQRSLMYLSDRGAMCRLATEGIEQI